MYESIPYARREWSSWCRKGRGSNLLRVRCTTHTGSGCQNRRSNRLKKFAHTTQTVVISIGIGIGIGIGIDIDINIGIGIDVGFGIGVHFHII